MNELLKYHDIVLEILKEARDKIILSKLNENDIDIKTNRRDLVTVIDKQTEYFISSKLKENFKNHYILGEETFIEDNNLYTNENVWIIDPIDATANFIKQKTDYCILIAFFKNKIPKLAYIFDIKKNELIHSIEENGVFINNIKIQEPSNISLKESLISIDVRKMWNSELLELVINNSFDLRYIGCAGLDGFKVARGHFGAFICPDLGPWDFAPLLLIAKELGLHISDFKGNDLEFSKRSDLIISTHQTYMDIKNLLKNK